MQRELVERAMAGDHDAFSELARVSIGRLYVVARLIVRDDNAAEDATQEALVSAWTHLGALRDPDRFDAWLHRLLVRACYREAGRHRRRGSVEVRVPVSPDGSRIAYIAAEPFTHGFLTVANADGSNRKRLIETPVFWLTPQWSPDGTIIVVHTQQDQDPPIWLVDSEAGAVLARLSTTPVPGSEDDLPGSADIWAFERLLP